MRRGVVAAVVVAVVGLGTGCSDDSSPGGGANDDPTTTSSPPVPQLPTTIVPSFASAVEEVTSEDLPASWRPGCPLAVEALRLLRVPHWGFDGAIHEGRIVVAEEVASEVVEVFAELYAVRYPIERMEPVDVYGGSDDASMDANNTSGFNCRLATGGTGWSEHAYGRAIDLNPLQNPYVRGDTVLPPQSARYADRTSTDQGVIHDGDPAVVAFAAHGWVWGGTWQTLKDYQHFSPSGR